MIDKRTKGIYKLWFDGSDRVYIGSAKNINSRIKLHVANLLNKLHPNTYLSTAFNKYGLLNMRWEVLEDCGNLTQKQMLIRENYYIGLYKSNIDGYNKATYTTSKKKDCYRDIDSLGKVEDYMEVINKFKSDYCLNIKKIEVGIFKDENINYSKSWFNNVKEDILSIFMDNIFNYCHNYIKHSLKNTMVVIPSYVDNTRVKHFSETHARGKLGKVIRKVYDNKPIKYQMKTICVFGQFNPLHLEMNDMRKLGTLDVYRVYSLIRTIEHVEKEKNLTLCFPCGLYDIFNKYLG